MKPADDDPSSGIVARVWNLSDNPANCTLNLPSVPITPARHLSHSETPVDSLLVTDGALTDSLAAQQIKT